MALVIAAFIRRWLAAPHVEVGEKGSKVLGDILDVDCELPPLPSPPHPMANGVESNSQLVRRRAPGQGAMWRRVFQDSNIYSIIVALCSGRDPDTANDGKQLSLAQGRLLRIIPHLAALNFNAVSTPPTFSSHAPGITNGASLASESAMRRSLLRFAALDMVDKSDVLMALSLVDFFESFVSIMRVTPYSAAKVETIRGLLRDATAADQGLRAALLSLPDRTVPEEADDLRRWLREVLPGGSVRVAGQLS
jgi:hypothetical protein